MPVSLPQYVVEVLSRKGLIRLKTTESMKYFDLLPKEIIQREELFKALPLDAQCYILVLVSLER